MPTRVKMIPYFRMEYLKTIPYPAAHTCPAHIRETPAPRPSPKGMRTTLKKNPPMGQKSLVIKWPNFCFGIFFKIYPTLIKSRTLKNFRSILVTHESRRFFHWLEDKQANDGISVNEIAYFICFKSQHTVISAAFRCFSSALSNSCIKRSVSHLSFSSLSAESKKQGVYPETHTLAVFRVARF